MSERNPEPVEEPGVPPMPVEVPPEPDEDEDEKDQ